MSRYYFHVHDGSDSLDREGTELPDIDAARAEALSLAGEIIREVGKRGDFSEDWRLTVTDDNGLTLFIMAFVVSASAAAERLKRIR